MNNLYTFPKEERLCSTKRIDSLFVEGKAFIIFPLRCVYKVYTQDRQSSVEVLFSVPKKRFKKAVHRNKIKRRMKEAYRLNKANLINNCNNKGISIDIAFSYVSDKPSEYKIIEEKILMSIEKIIKKTSRDTSLH
jgi:ribonuclease P protein component